MTRNPDWARDELILALDLYFRSGRKWLPHTHPDVIALSHILNTLPIHDLHTRNNNFRNPRGVSMKLGNFLSIDPQYQGIGLSRGGKLDKDVWNDFSQDIRLLSQISTSIVNFTKIVDKSDIFHKMNDDNEEFPEGFILTRLHKYKERNRKIIELRKQKMLREIGRLVCEVCDFDFEQTYGKIGRGFAECHHTIPISQLDENHKTRITELAIVCANCHRMIHRYQPMLAVQDIRIVVQRNIKSSIYEIKSPISGL